MQLQELREQIKICKKCYLAETRNNVVPGEGGVKSQVLLVGEGPGKNEDLQGRPFIGAAGKFLEEMLNVIGWKREDVFIANVVKCRPPNNRDPLPEEIKACWPWLEAQINLIQPKIIVSLGRHSLNCFFPDFKISDVHGKALRREFLSLGKTVFFPCYHPAAALYNGSLRKTLIRDFKKIPKVLKLLN